jgi:hypothetical protein
MSGPIDDVDHELIGRAIAIQNQIDYEDTGPKAPHGDITYKGVRLSSRFDVQSEFNHMKAVIDSMPELMGRRIESIWCDSKGCAFYTVTIQPARFVDDLPYLIEDAFKARGGYNGLSIECEGQDIPYRDCYWPGEVD